ncbi:2,3-oxidosqualene cyclase [Methylococcus sp. Mc7]|uniref:2,3-oxidosqualene cyclase n=1 Tax=Methylococcus sp. Mc7 TaxID=2860258 RepID=UPI001C529589|nr:2,3-oxidosqualene cyclase [Methylococcus sp. Mc7]QXP85532.1 2,3-oxidosqualene cyclase [Methylococcus sp. Mc7]
MNAQYEESIGEVPGGVAQRARAAMKHLLSLQRPAGDWEGEMVWCTMILAQAVIVRAVVGRPYSERERAEIVKHFEVSQLPDGAWGMHPESPGYVFFTALAYVALRLLGLRPDTPLLVRARAWLHARPEGVKAVPTWGKFWLALLGLYGREGVNAVPPELFLLPRWLPFHPSRFYCHTRLIYLGIAYLSGGRFAASLPEPLRDALRAELYAEPYESIDFGAYRHAVARTDLYVPISRVLRLVYDLLARYEHRPWKALRRRALAVCFEQILREQRSTRYQSISPVSGLLNCLAIFAHDPRHPDLAPSLEGVEAWRWEDEAEGLRYVGARSNSWDTAFAVQALAELPQLDEEAERALNRAQGFLDEAQMTEELADYREAWRDPALGGWCFSDGRHRWPVSDCAAEAVSALFALYERGDVRIAARLGADRLRLGVEFILSRQNADGGFGTYERRRGGRLLELVNPSEMFGQCMTELSYIECTGSSLGALAHYLRHYPDLPGGRIATAIRKAESFLRSRQLDDGSFPGFWGINYTYAVFHVVKGLRMAGAEPADPVLQSAAGWLLAKQRPDGGWGEHYSSCLEGRYVESGRSQTVMTAWALLALMEVYPAAHEAVERGIAWLSSQQRDDGGWPRQGVNGVFFGAAMLDYRLYHIYFPVWALARYVRLEGAKASPSAGLNNAGPAYAGAEGHHDTGYRR